MSKVAPEKGRPFDEILAEIKKIVAMRSATDPGADFRRAGCIYNILGALLKETKLSNKKWIMVSTMLLRTFIA